MDSLGSGGPPARVPDVGSLDLTYEEIADGEVIGQGGNADVFGVTVQRDGREVPVAVKQPRLQGTLDTDTVDRFVQEADVWAELDGHEHIVSLHDWSAEPLPWLAMEYMDRGTLADVPDGERLPLEQALWVGVCVCRAVHHAHRFGVAHHDIKPANVLFTSSGDGWAVPKVSDWGLARLMLDETGSVEEFSPHYAAPEQFDAEQYGSPDDRTDIYQVGTLVYELVTGRPPFEGSATAVMQGVLSKEPTPPSEVADVPAELDDILGEALAKEPDERYDTVVYLRDRLKQLFEEQHGDSSAASGQAPAGAVPTDKQNRTDVSSPSDESPQTESHSANTEPEGRTTETTGQPNTDTLNITGSARVALGAVAVLAVAMLLVLVVATGAIDLGGNDSASLSDVDVSFSESDYEVTAGESLSVTVDITNNGDSEVNGTVGLEPDGPGDSRPETFRVDSEESDTATFNIETGSQDAGEYTITARVLDGEQTANTTVTVIPQASPSLSGLEINGTGAEASIINGSDESVSVDVTNDGGQAGEFDVTLDIGDTTETATTGELAAGDSESVTFESVTEGLDAGEYDVTVSAGEETVSGDLTIEPVGFDVSIGKVTEGNRLSVEVTLTDDGDRETPISVTVDNGVGEDTIAINLDQTKLAKLPIREGKQEYSITVTPEGSNVVLATIEEES